MPVEPLENCVYRGIRNANPRTNLRCLLRSHRRRADFTATSRRFVHWDQVNETQMPFLTMLKTGEVRGRQSEGCRR